MNGRQLFILPLDHHVSPGTAVGHTFNAVLYDGLRTAIAGGIPAAWAGIFLDEGRHSMTLADAAASGLTTVRTVGTADLGFELDDGDIAALEAGTRDAGYWRSVAHANPGGDAAATRRQMSRLLWLSDALGPPARPRLLCDLARATEDQRRRGIPADERDPLSDMTVGAVAEILDAGVEVGAWVLGGFAQSDDDRRVLSASRNGPGTEWFSRGAGHHAAATSARMAAGLSVSGVSGVILGRSCFSEVAAAWTSGRMPRTAAVAVVASEFRRWVWRLSSSMPERRRVAGSPKTRSDV